MVRELLDSCRKIDMSDHSVKIPIATREAQWTTGLVMSRDSDSQILLGLGQEASRLAVF